MKTSKTIMGVLGGVAVGTALGILFAPDKGTNTRKKIAKKSNDAKDSIKNYVSDVLENFSEKYDSMLNKAEDLVTEAKGDLDTVKNQINK